MEKITLIIGDADSGKTMKAKEIASSYKEENVVWICGYEYNKHNDRHDVGFLYRRCNLNTELLIIDDLNDVSHIGWIYSHLYEGVRVEKIFKEPFYIHPKIIITCKSNKISIDDLPTESNSFKRRFSIINCNDRAKRLSDEDSQPSG